MEEKIFKFVEIKYRQRYINETEEQKHSVYVSKNSSYIVFSFYLTGCIQGKFERLKIQVSESEHILRFYFCNDKDGLKINKFQTRKIDGKTRAYVCSSNLSNYIRDFFDKENFVKLQLVCSDNISTSESCFIIEVKQKKWE